MATDPEPPAGAASNLPLPATAEAVLTFIESVGRRSEAELYLRLFRRLPKESFAIIAPGAPVIRQGQGAFTEQLRFLADLGLGAPLVLGLLDPAQALATGERLSKRMDAAGLDYIRHAASEPNLPERLRVELRAGRWPIVELAELASQSATERLAWVGRLAAELETRKLVLLRRRGHMHLSSERALALADRLQLPLDDGGLSLVNLRTDGEILTGQKLLRREDVELLELVRLLLESAPLAKLLVSVTSPLDLLRELFTVKGAGTLLKLGSAFQRSDDYAGVDRARLSQLLSSSFGYELRDDFFEKAPAAVYLEQDYRAAAILHEAEDAPYLTKFAVDPEAQGEGLGRDLWQLVARDFPRMFWRTRADNPISTWYASVCDGLVRLPRWHVFWRGLEPASVPRLVEHALGLGDDFVR